MLDSDMIVAKMSLVTNGACPMIAIPNPSPAKAKVAAAFASMIAGLKAVAAEAVSAEDKAEYGAVIGNLEAGEFVKAEKSLLYMDSFAYQAIPSKIVSQIKSFAASAKAAG